MLRIFQTRLCLRQMSVMTLTFKRVPDFRTIDEAVAWVSARADTSHIVLGVRHPVVFVIGEIAADDEAEGVRRGPPGTDELRDFLVEMERSDAAILSHRSC